MVEDMMMMVVKGIVERAEAGDPLTEREERIYRAWVEWKEEEHISDTRPNNPDQ